MGSVSATALAALLALAALPLGLVLAEDATPSTPASALLAPTAPATTLCAAPAGDSTSDGAASVGSVPCGYIYPRILLTDSQWPGAGPALSSAPYQTKMSVAFTYDPMSEGFALNDPTNPIVVTFEFPKRPDWLSISIEPKSVNIPIEPQYFHPGAADPSNPSMIYYYETNVTMTVSVVGKPVLPDGVNQARFLIFAKSTESGLYKPGYGIREFKGTPAGAIHQSDLGPQPVITPVALPSFHPVLSPLDMGPGVSAKVSVPSSISLWNPTPVSVTVTPVGGPLGLGLVDATGHVLSFQVADASTATFTSNLTFPNAGTYAIVVYDGAPANAVGATSITIPPLPAGSAYRMPRDYRMAFTDSFDRVAANTGEVPAQDERTYPFAVYEGASGADLAVSISTPGLPLGRGVANLNIAVLDPTGTVLATGTLDASNPAKDFPVGGLPGPGLYRIRVYGSQLPALAQFHVALDVQYDLNILLGSSDVPWAAAPAILGSYNASIQVKNPVAWTTSAATIKVTRADHSAAPGTASALVAVLDANGTARAVSLASAEDLSNFSVPLTFPRNGVYTIVAFPLAIGASDRASPMDIGDSESATQWGRAMIAQTVTVGDMNATTFTYKGPWSGSGGGEFGTTPTRIGLWTIPAAVYAASSLVVHTQVPPGAQLTVSTGAGSSHGNGSDVASYSTADMFGDGPNGTGTGPSVQSSPNWFVTVIATASGPAGGRATLSLSYPSPSITEANPLSVPQLENKQSTFSVPAPGLPEAFGAAALASLILALRRRAPGR
ncbi:MAG: hypothetical protein ACYDDF_02810 [Thermoplasmatota archaeon]